jgi:hypothetical protein
LPVFAILDLPARDIDNELGGLAEIAGALWVLVITWTSPY